MEDRSFEPFRTWVVEVRGRKRSTGDDALWWVQRAIQFIGRDEIGTASRVYMFQRSLSPKTLHPFRYAWKLYCEFATDSPRRIRKPHPVMVRAVSRKHRKYEPHLCQWLRRLTSVGCMEGSNYSIKPRHLAAATRQDVFRHSTFEYQLGAVLDKNYLRLRRQSRLPRLTPDATWDLQDLLKWGNHTQPDAPLVPVVPGDWIPMSSSLIRHLSEISGPLVDRPFQTRKPKPTKIYLPDPEVVKGQSTSGFYFGPKIEVKEEEPDNAEEPEEAEEIDYVDSIGSSDPEPGISLAGKVRGEKKIPSSGLSLEDILHRQSLRRKRGTLLEAVRRTLGPIKQAEAKETRAEVNPFLLMGPYAEFPDERGLQKIKVESLSTLETQRWKSPYLTGSRIQSLVMSHDPKIPSPQPRRILLPIVDEDCPPPVRCETPLPRRRLLLGGTKIARPPED